MIQCILSETRKNETDYSILIVDAQKQFTRENYDGKFLSHYELMLLENILDIFIRCSRG